jgi:hypothetical protein
MVTKVSSTPRVKAKSKTGRVKRAGAAKTKLPEGPVSQFIGGVAEVVAVPVAGLVYGATTALDAILDGLTYVATAAYEFMGKIFATIQQWVAAVMAWLGNCIAAVTGKTKEAFSYVREVVASKNVDWIAVNTVAIKALCAAAAVGVAITGGVLVGGTVGTLALTAGATVEASKMVAIMSSAITGGVLAEACYTFMKAGLKVDDIARARGSVLSLA